MNARKLLLYEFVILLAAGITGVFVWRYWYLPMQIEARRMAQIAPAPVPAVPAARVAPATPVPTTPAVPATPVPATAAAAVSAPSATPAAPPPAAPAHPSLLKNSSFTEGMAYWSLWREAKTYSNSVRIISAAMPNGARPVLRIENPYKAHIGVQQLARVVSGSVYRLSAAVRSVAGQDTNIIFGGRVAVYLPPQREQQIVWMTEYNQWWRRELIFTNLVDGVATVYAHLGYGGVATTGEFRDITLERL